jgi:GT2 family glycosyltransferase
MSITSASVDSVRKSGVLTIIIVTWNCKEEISACLESLRELRETQLEFETIIVDNGSQDGTSQFLQSHASSFNEIGLKVTYNSRNTGLSSATEQAYRKAKGDWILLCNPDIAFSAAVSQLVSYGLSHPDAMITVDMVNDDGSTQRVIHRRFPTVSRAFFDFGIVGSYLDDKVMNHLVRKYYCYQTETFAPVAAIDQPGASLLFLSRAVVEKLGFIFDTSLPVWWNDVDLARRAEKAGIPRILLSYLKVTHGLGRSGSNKMSTETRFYVFFRSMMRYARTWKMHPQLLQMIFCADAIFGVPLYAVIQGRVHGFAKGLKRSILRAAAQTTGVLGD